MRLKIADSPWPRTGGDRANRGRLASSGPRRGRILHEIPLPGTDPADVDATGAPGGIVVGSDGALRVSLGGVLSALSPAGEPLWSADLRPARRTGRVVMSAPLALVRGHVAVTVPPYLYILDASGEVVWRLKVSGTLDDSGPSLNVTRDGRLVLTHMSGEVQVLERGKLRTLDLFGYDILPPAFYADETLAVSGFAGEGFVRVALDGRVIWRTQLVDVDLVPSINRYGDAAVGALNDGKSFIVSTDGRIVGTYRRAAIFAEAPARTWIALSKDRVARIRRDGTELWMRRIQPPLNLRWGTMSPIVDGRSRTYIAARHGLWCLDAQGADIFRVTLGSKDPTAQALVGPGRAAVLCEGRLFLLE